MDNKTIWTNADSAMASKQGWDFFEVGGGAYELEREDMPLDGSAPVFKSDTEALRFVEKQAAAGDELAQRALRFLDENCPNECTKAGHDYEQAHDDDYFIVEVEILVEGEGGPGTTKMYRQFMRPSLSAAYGESRGDTARRASRLGRWEAVAEMKNHGLTVLDSKVLAVQGPYPKPPHLVLMNPCPEPAWTTEDAAQASKQGWNLFDVGGGAFQLQKEDEPEAGAPVYDSDTDAMLHVSRQAAACDELAIRALRFLKAHGDDLHECYNCGALWLVDDLEEIRHASMRMTPGDPTPSGQCPACKALCYPVRIEEKA